MVTLSVEYHLTDGFIDDQLDEIAGRDHCSSGCYLASRPPERDIQWEFPSREEAIWVGGRMKEVEGVYDVTVDGDNI